MVATLLSRYWFVGLAGICGTLVALRPLLSTLVIVLFAVCGVLLVVAVKARGASLAGALVASSCLLPLALVAGHPLDNYVALAVLPLAVSLRLARTAPRTEPRTSLFAVGLLLLTLAALLPGLVTASDSWTSAARFLSYAAMISILGLLSDEERVWIVRIALGTGVVLAASVFLTYVQWVNLPVYDDREAVGTRAGGLIGHPNFAGYFLSLLILYVLSRPTMRPPLRLFLLGSFTAALLLTGSRTASIFCVMGALLLFRHWRRQIVVMALLASCLVYLMGRQMIDRFTSLEATGGITGQNSAGWRLGQWRFTIDHLYHPFAPTGVGWSMARTLLPGGLGVHNGYLQVAVELGLIGIVGLLVFAAGLVRAAQYRGFSEVVLVLYVLAANMTDLVLFYPPVTYLLLILVLGTPSANYRVQTSIQEKARTRPSTDEERSRRPELVR